MSRPPSQKGTSVLPVVVALEHHPDRNNRDPCCEWNFKLARTAESEAYVASLSPSPER